MCFHCHPCCSFCCCMPTNHGCPVHFLRDMIWDDSSKSWDDQEFKCKYYIYIYKCMYYIVTYTAYHMNIYVYIRVYLFICICVCVLDVQFTSVNYISFITYWLYISIHLDIYVCVYVPLGMWDSFGYTYVRTHHVCLRLSTVVCCEWK